MIKHCLQAMICREWLKPVPRAMLLICCGWFSVGLATAADWPQILGPGRDGKAGVESLKSDWPSDGPTVIWSRAVGRGFAGVACSGGRVVVFHRMANELVAEAVEAGSGKPLWKVAFPSRYVSTISSDDGPRCVPLVDGNAVYLVGPGGEMQCIALDSGKKIWFRNLRDDFKAQDGYFGFGSSPIVESGKVLLNVGGSGGAGIVALSPTDGSTLWKATDEAASYSSPVAATVDTIRHVVFVTRLNVVSLDPADGSVRFRFPFGARGPTVNAANPLILADRVLADHVFVSASYGVGAQWAKIGARAATKIWDSDEVMSSQYTTCVETGGYLYGIDGRQDVGGARLRCFDPRSGKVQWTQEDYGTGNLILADGKLLIMKTAGELVLAEPSPKEYRPLARVKLFDNTVQALPALADGLFFARDTQTLKCVTLGKASTAKSSK